MTRPALAIIVAVTAIAVITSAGCRSAGRGKTLVRFWAMGREGEVVQELVTEFERENPGIHVQVQQIPWSAAHEKLLTAHVGGSSPDLAQLGNTWISEFVALDALEPLANRVASSQVVSRSAYFGGIWDTNVIDEVPYGIPWYVDTRVIFYRRDLLARAGYSAMPGTWGGWRDAMIAMKSKGIAEYGIFLPVNEWTAPVVLGLEAGSPLLGEHDTRGAFGEAPYARAFDFFLDLFRDGLAPPVRNSEVANLYQEFARGYFAMYITGPWNLGEFRRRLPAELQDAWATAPMPGPDEASPGVSLAGGSSLVMFQRSAVKDEAWRFIEFLSAPQRQARFYRLSGDLPARVEAWEDSALTADPMLAAFREQLTRVVPTPRIPEWEQIATRVQECSELAVRGHVRADSVLALLDRDVDRLLEKRRWLFERSHREEPAHGS